MPKAKAHMTVEAAKRELRESLAVLQRERAHVISISKGLRAAGHSDRTLEGWIAGGCRDFIAEDLKTAIKVVRAELSRTRAMVAKETRAMVADDARCEAMAKTAKTERGAEEKARERTEAKRKLELEQAEGMAAVPRKLLIAYAQLVEGVAAMFPDPEDRIINKSVLVVAGGLREYGTKGARERAKIRAESEAQA